MIYGPRQGGLNDLGSVAVLPDTSVESFRAYMQHARSKNTAIKYGQAAQRLLLFLGKNNLTVKNVPPGVLSLFAESLKHENCKPATVHTFVAGAKRYLEWLRAKGHVLPTISKADLPRVHSPPPNVVRGNDLLRFLTRASIQREPTRTATLLLPYCGLRSFELVGLKLTDIKRVHVPAYQSKAATEMVCLTVRGKGDDYRVVPLLLDGKPLLIAYLKGWRRLQPGDWLFPMPGGGHMSTRTLRDSVKTIRDDLNLGKRVTPHTLRRTYTTTLHAQGVDVATLTKIVGHKSVQTTMDHYLAIEEDRIAGATTGVRLVAKGGTEDLTKIAGKGLHDFLTQTQEARGVAMPAEMMLTPEDGPEGDEDDDEDENDEDE